MKPARPAFSILLPCVDIAIWLTFVIVPIMLTAWRLHLELAPTDYKTIHFRSSFYTLSRKEVVWFLLDVVPEKVSHSITTINLPAMAVDVLTSIRTWPESWSPSAIGFDSWRSLAFPIYCLPAWWFAGRGIDGLMQRRQLRWYSFLLGTLLFLLFVTLFFGLRFGLPSSDHDDIGWILWGLALWTFLFVPFPVGWFRKIAGIRRQHK